MKVFTGNPVKKSSPAISSTTFVNMKNPARSFEPSQDLLLLSRSFTEEEKEKYYLSDNYMMPPKPSSKPVFIATPIKKAAAKANVNMREFLSEKLRAHRFKIRSNDCSEFAYADPFCTASR
uniref:Uncharacterized protein n=1 Tax=Vespula pensylvanica TaxID=30213 RepID=A0A834UF35_VESPE|nr:hypothetical protein H0235_003211 [Vespula pensylvanica]